MAVPTITIKFLELVCVTVCLILQLYSYDLTDVPTLMICTGTYVAFFIILSGEIVGEITMLQLDVLQDMIFGLAGVVLFATSGCLVLSARLKNQPPDYPRTGDHRLAVVEGGVAIAVAFMMLFDSSLAYLESDEYENSSVDTR